MADFYFKEASQILKTDINIDEPYKLMVRNIQKRLFIGIGTELLLKALFLKNDFCINRVKNGTPINPRKPIKFSEIANQDDLNLSDTYTLNVLIDHLSDTITLENYSIVKKGLKIAKVFRNKEGHVAVLWHKAVRQNYSDIEHSISSIYKEGFSENLDFKVSFLDGEESIFVIKS